LKTRFAEIIALNGTYRFITYYGYQEIPSPARKSWKFTSPFFTSRRKSAAL